MSGEELGGHPGRRLLERFSVEDLPAAQQGEVAMHVASCPRCHAFLDELGALQAERLVAVPPEQFLAQVAARRDAGADLASAAERRARRPSRTLGRISVLVAASALVLLLPRLRPGPSTDGDEVRLKGGGFSLLRQRGAEVTTLPAGGTIRAGDALEVAVTLPRPARVAAWFVDASGRVDAMLEGGPVALAAGRSTLPGSARVESPCVDMTLVAVAGEEATLQAVERALRGPGGAAQGLVAARALPGTFTQPLRCE